LCAGGVAAQSRPSAMSARDPLDAAQPVPAIQHRSAIATHRRHAEQALVPWREANDTVARIGGWRTYAREVSPGDVPSNAPGTPQAAPGHGPHPGAVRPAP
jgi:hypothetical protein